MNSLTKQHHLGFMFGGILLILFLSGCTQSSRGQPDLPTTTPRPADQALTEDEIATLSSIEKLDDHPLYTMRYVGDYPRPLIVGSDLREEEPESVNVRSFEPSWGCALFAALGDPELRLYGRNFDWRFSPALLLFTNPSDGYASVSMVDIEYLGFGGEDLTELPVEELVSLLEAPTLPFDGMNETGLAIGMAAVPSGNMDTDPQKPTIDELGVMREVLDHAGTVDEAIDIIGSFNIDMGNVLLHYLVASKAGDSALVEFYRGKMAVMRNEEPWQLATNFLVTSVDGRTEGQCHRYDIVSSVLEDSDGVLDVDLAMNLLSKVSQDSPDDNADTEWSVVYDMTSGGVNIVMDRKFDGEIYLLQLAIPLP
ncbi:MAG: linear amide C-N hydrolase [Anaerolineaceae bacterium]|nr:linear amide C-N hydrolase [Anaerolineaceae bacterium]